MSVALTVVVIVVLMVVIVQGIKLSDFLGERLKSSPAEVARKVYQEKNTPSLDSDYSVVGTFRSTVSWITTDFDFDNPGFVARACIFGAKPKPGQTITGEFHHRFTKFVITEVKSMHNPRDQHFVDAVPVFHKMK